MIKLIHYMNDPARLLLISSLLLFPCLSFAQDDSSPPAILGVAKALGFSKESPSAQNTQAPATPAQAPAVPVQAAPAVTQAPAQTAPVQTAPAPVPTSAPPAVNTGITPPSDNTGAQTNGNANPVQLIDPTLFGTVQDPSFQNMTTKMFPMTPDQIGALHQVYDSTQSAIAAPVSSPKPMLSSQTVSLSPGSVPPVIRLATGYVSSILFLDETGMPWPITSYNLGDPKSFNIQWDQESNTLMIQGQGPYSTGNMAVVLQDLNTPMMFTLVSDQRVVDYRIDFRVQGRGPHASGSANSGASKNGNALLMNLLDGVAPKDARQLEVVGGGAQAWVRGATMFLRTPLTLLSPSWDATMSSADGTKVYQLSATPLVLVSDRGRSQTLTIKGL